MPRKFSKYAKKPYRKRPRRSVPWYNRRYSPGEIATKAYQGFKYIKGLINVEKKFFDQTTVTNPDNSGTVISLSNIAEGNDYNNRNGNSVLAQSLQLRANIAINNTVLTTFVRCILFADNDQRGTDPAVTDVLESAAVTSGLNHIVNKRFTILFDRTYPLGSATNQSVYVNKFIKYNRHIKYKSTAGADASAYEGNLFMLLLSDQAANTPTVGWLSRLRYTDN